jgi:hypothetical protein
MSEDNLSPIPDELSREFSAQSSPVNTDSTSFWSHAVAAHAVAALDLLAELNVPEQSVALEATLAVDRIRTTEAASADDLKLAQQHVHNAYAHAEHTPALAARVAALDARAAWSFSQYLYERAAGLAELEPRLSALEHDAHVHQAATGVEFHLLHRAIAAASDDNQRLDAQYAELYQQILHEMQAEVDAGVARASVALYELHKKHESQISTLCASYSALETKFDCINEAYVLQQARAKPVKRWSIFSNTDTDADLPCLRSLPIRPSSPRPHTAPSTRAASDTRDTLRPPN